MLPDEGPVETLLGTWHTCLDMRGCICTAAGGAGAASHNSVVGIPCGVITTGLAVLDTAAAVAAAISTCSPLSGVVGAQFYH